MVVGALRTGVPMLHHDHVESIRMLARRQHMFVYMLARGFTKYIIRH